ncbi:uncharacterized protein LOC108149267 isoform X2 [Drosophila elegans]|uniref:uncharacterized protein LOC108149267 isoform X2 n=1 Tax=Drosophila elegans TaxID=30023 RepID=UPI0007E6D508|nr:uncharacterized protein LOC108149267 isoform X2 [Drosophila elegans]
MENSSEGEKSQTRGGNYEMANDVTYLPVFPADKVDSKGHFIPRAENVIYSNLRRTVVALASPETPLPYRIIFEQDNAIPGAIWSDHVLLNADEIIPEAHSADDLDRDYRNITPWLHTLQTLAPKLFSGNLTLDTTGNKAMFLCNSQNGLRIPNDPIDFRLEKTIDDKAPALDI